MHFVPPKHRYLFTSPVDDAVTVFLLPCALLASKFCIHFWNTLYYFDEILASETFGF